MKVKKHKNTEELAVFACLTITGEKIRRPVPIDMLVDTGSPWTVITPKEYERLKIPLRTLERASDISQVYLSGHTFWRYLLYDVTLRFRDENGKLIKVDLPLIGVLVPTKKDREVEDIPSILGCDFLKQTCFTFVYNPCNNLAYFESDDISDYLFFG